MDFKTPGIIISLVCLIAIIFSVIFNQIDLIPILVLIGGIAFTSLFPFRIKIQQVAILIVFLITMFLIKIGYGWQDPLGEYINVFLFITLILGSISLIILIIFPGRIADKINEKLGKLSRFFKSHLNP